MPRLLYVLAGALGAAAIVLAAWGWRVGQRFEDQLARAAQVQAELLGREFADETRAANQAMFAQVFGDLAKGRVPWDSRVPAHLDSAVHVALECECVSIVPPTGGFFWWTSTAPQRLATIGIDSARAEALRRTLARVVRPRDGDITGTVILKADNDGRELTAPVHYEVRNGVSNAAGFVGDPRQYAAKVLSPAAERVQRRLYGDAGARIAGWRVLLPGGDTVVRLGRFDTRSPAVSVAFFRPRFQSEAPSSGPTLLAPVGPAWPPPHAGEPPDPRSAPYRLIVQVDPTTIGEFLYGTRRGPAGAALALVVVALALTTATLLLARRMLQHVREREAFATAVAHDLRTPLTQILLYGESLQLDRPAIRAREEAARIIVRETRRLIHLVENALQFVRGDRARPSLRLERLDLAAVVRDTLAGFQPVLDRARVTANLDLSTNAHVTGDRDSVVQVLTNLIDNAVRFGPRGQTLTLTLREDAEYVTLQLDDEGPGIPTDMRDDVFKPFVRAGSSQGSGIGLAVARQLVELMDGRLSAGAAPGGGVRMTVVMRRAAPESPVMSEPAEEVLQ